MKIALIGYGKMGKAIEEIALSKGHEIVLRIGSNNQHDFTTANIQQADVCIEFSTPHTAFEQVMKCIEAGKPVVCGSTAWLDKLPLVHEAVKKNNTAFLFASNFSIGVNLFFKLNSYLAKLMKPYTDYSVSIEEIHHTEKKDAPSGTAVTLAEGILEERSDLSKWVNNPAELKSELPIVSIRKDPAPGTHSIKYESDIDFISITHHAHNRKGFAAGALLASEFLHDKQGIFTMQEVLHLPE